MLAGFPSVGIQASRPAPWESGVDFVACDNPHANRLTIHILAAVAEDDEAKRISDRTYSTADRALLAEYGAHVDENDALEEMRIE